MKPERPVFNREWRQSCSVCPCSTRDVSEFIRLHYLGTRPGVVTLALMMLRDVFSCGMIIYALPPPETSVRYGVLTWEMARLWIGDEVPQNGETWLISQSIKYIKKHHRDVGIIVTYADPSVGHQGTIYRAANFTPDGMTGDKRDRYDLVNAENGKRYSRASHVPLGVDTIRRQRVSKHRFIYDLALKS